MKGRERRNDEERKKKRRGEKEEKKRRRKRKQFVIKGNACFLLFLSLSVNQCSECQRLYVTYVFWIKLPGTCSAETNPIFTVLF